MLRYIVMCVSLVCATYLSAKDISLDMFNAIEMASENTLQSLKANNLYAERQLDYNAYKAQYLPSVNFNVTPVKYNRSIVSRYDYITNNEIFRAQDILSSDLGFAVYQNIWFTGGRVFVRSNLSQVTNINTNSKSQFTSVPIYIGYSQTLFGFNRFKWDKKIEPLKYSVAQKQLIYDMAEIAETAVGFFFEYILALTQYDLSSYILNSKDTLYNIAQERYRISSISKNDLLALELELINSKRSNKDQEIKLQKSLFRLKNYLQIEDNVDISVVLPDISENVDIVVDDALRLCRENNPNYLLVETNILDARKTLDNKKRSSSYASELSLSVGLNQYADNIPDAYKDPMRQNAISLSLSIPVLDWGVRKGQVNVAQRNLEAVEEQMDQQKRVIEQDVILAIKTFDNNKDNVALAAKSREIAEEAYVITSRRFVEGISGFNELAMATNQYKQACNNYIFILRDYWLSFFYLRKLTLFDYIKATPLRIEYP